MTMQRSKILVFLRRLTSFVIWSYIILMIIYLAIAPTPGLFDAKIGQTSSVFAQVDLGENDLETRLPDDEESGNLRIENSRLLGGSADLVIETTHKPLILIHILILVIYSVPAMIFFILFRRMIRTSLEGRPFDSRNTSRLRWMGWLTLSISFIYPLLENLKARYIMSLVELEGQPISPTIDVSLEGIFAGLVLLALSAVFAYGSEMEHDRSLTV